MLGALVGCPEKHEFISLHCRGVLATCPGRRDQVGQSCPWLQVFLLGLPAGRSGCLCAASDWRRVDYGRQPCLLQGGRFVVRGCWSYCGCWAGKASPGPPVQVLERPACV